MAEVGAERASRSRRRRVGVAAIYLAVWFALTVVAAVAIFLQSERTTTVASHDAVVSPDFGGQVTVRTGPVLPDLRADSGSLIGVEVVLGKTDAPSLPALTQRYAAAYLGVALGRYGTTADEAGSGNPAEDPAW